MLACIRGNPPSPRPQRPLCLKQRFEPIRCSHRRGSPAPAAAQPAALSAARRFPLVVYAHGFDNRGEIDYTRLGQDLASWGFVVAFPKSCHLGCKADCRTLPFDPPCFGDYYKQQLRAIEWSRSPHIRAALPVDERLLVGVAGHSMGGQVRAGGRGCQGKQTMPIVRRVDGRCRLYRPGGCAGHLPLFHSPPARMGAWRRARSQPAAPAGARVWAAHGRDAGLPWDDVVSGADRRPPLGLIQPETPTLPMPPLPMSCLSPTGIGHLHHSVLCAHRPPWPTRLGHSPASLRRRPHSRPPSTRARTASERP